jgi:hypothetical protein
MNWRVLNERRRAINALMWIVAFFVLLPLAVMSDGIFYVFLFLPAWFFLSCQPQAAYLFKTYGRAYPRRAWLTPVFIGFVAHGVVISVANAIMKKYFPGWV